MELGEMHRWWKLQSEISIGCKVRKFEIFRTTVQIHAAENLKRDSSSSSNSKKDWIGCEMIAWVGDEIFADYKLLKIEIEYYFKMGFHEMGLIIWRWG